MFLPSVFNVSVLAAFVLASSQYARAQSAPSDAPPAAPSIAEVMGDWTQDEVKTPASSSNLLADVTASIVSDVKISATGPAGSNTATIQWQIVCKATDLLTGKQLATVQTQSNSEATLSISGTVVVATITKGDDGTKTIDKIDVGNGETINNFTCNNSVPAGAIIPLIPPSADTAYAGDLFVVLGWDSSGNITSGFAANKK